MAKDYYLTQMYMPFYAACVATTIGFLFFFMSFSSPYWLQSYDRVHSNFLHMGIWSVCFDRFVHPKDYHANVLTGCYWLFDPFFFKIGIWQWLDPGWLIAVQVLITIAFITQCCVLLILVLYYLFFGNRAAESTMAMSGQLFIAVLLTLAVITFAIESQDRSWMPRPDQYFLSWSFGFAVLAALSSYIAAGFLYCLSYTDRASEEEVERFEAVMHQYGQPSVFSGRGGASAYGWSLYGGTQSVGGVVVKVPSTGTKPEQVITLDSDLRRMDGEGSASLFTPSLMHPRSGFGAPLPTVDEQADDTRHPLVASPPESQIPSTYGSDNSQQPLYTNQRYPRARETSNGQRPDEHHSYSPLEEDEMSQSNRGSDLNYARGSRALQSMNDRRMYGTGARNQLY
ncbi:hypothetical protein CRM22_001411 [Opisthorchis felineus]|uniref:PMP-22/EMP/MP20/Claudin tight junction n=1 Tax=Opisthorchis felineus TaxID=147828 RepID=A0A4S2MAX4_OPIFE|nr:hypothetical protein CRM22_001411 [Opisthorchis felineus]